MVSLLWCNTSTFSDFSLLGHASSRKICNGADPVFNWPDVGSSVLGFARWTGVHLYDGLLLYWLSASKADAR